MLPGFLCVNFLVEYPGEAVCVRLAAMAMDGILTFINRRLEIQPDK